MKTRQQLASWAMWVYDSKWLYGMGTYGQRLQTIYATLAKSWYYTTKNPTGFKVLTTAYKAGLNPRLYDCHGIVDGFRMDDDTTTEIDFDPALDISADMEFNRVKNAGTLGVDYGTIDKNMTDNAGYGYWKSGHFGVGVGDGQVVDIWSTGYPARKRDQTLGNWTYWVKCSDIDYSGTQGESDFMIVKGDGPNQAVYDLQTAYAKLGYAIGAFKNMVDNSIRDGRDGEYGDTCIGITKQIQSKHNLEQTGSVDAATYGKIAEDLINLGINTETVEALNVAQIKIKELDAKLVDSENKMAVLSETIESKDASILSLTKQTSDNQASINLITNEKEELSKKISDLQTAKDVAETNLDAEISNKKLLEEQILIMTENLDLANKELDSKIVEVTALEETQTKLEAEIKRVNGGLSTMTIGDILGAVIQKIKEIWVKKE
jgi:hypothetical protein